MKSSDISYIAGLLDGEGYIGMWRRTKNGYLWSEFEVVVTNTNIRALKFCQNLFGGRIRMQIPNYSRLSKKRVYRWRVGPQDGERLLKAVLRFLIIKRRRALEFLRAREKVRVYQHGRQTATGEKGQSSEDSVR